MSGEIKEVLNRLDRVDIEVANVNLRQNQLKSANEQAFCELKETIMASQNSGKGKEASSGVNRADLYSPTDGPQDLIGLNDPISFPPLSPNPIVHRSMGVQLLGVQNPTNGQNFNSPITQIPNTSQIPATQSQILPSTSNPHTQLLVTQIPAKISVSQLQPFQLLSLMLLLQLTTNLPHTMVYPLL